MVAPNITSAVLIGYGSIGQYHARLLHGRYQQLAIVDINESVRAKAHDDFPNVTIGQTLEELDSLDWRWDVTMAVIATWGPNHSTIFSDLVHRGARHILCEKPLAHSVEAGAEMVRVAEELGIALGVHHRFRYSGLAEGLGHLAQDLGIGEPCGFFAHGGARGLVTNGIYYIDLASDLFGRGPESVVGTAAGEPINPRSTDLMFYGGTAAWSFGCGREATVCFSNGSSVYGSVIIYYRDAVVELLTGREVEVRQRVAEEVQKFPAVTRTGRASDLAFKGPVPGIRTSDEATTMLLDEIETGTVRVFPPPLALEAVGACIGALAAGRERRAVQLPIDPASDLGRTQWPIS